MEIIKNDLLNDGASKASAKLYLNEDFADVNFLFKIDDEIQKVPANKNILAVLSPVFNAMFFGPNKDDNDVKIVDATIDTFKEFLQLFYLNKVTISLEKIEGVVRLADKYDVLEHLNASAVLLENKLTLENMCWGYQLAIMLDNETLKQFCEKYISGYPNDIFQSASFKRCDRIVLKHILQLDSLGCKEYEVFDACLVWAKFSCQTNEIDENKPENLKAQLGECFNLIRFGTMKPDEFATHTISHREMFSAEELSDLFYTTTVKDFKSIKFIQEPRSSPSFQWKHDQELSCLQENIISKNSSLSSSNSVYFSVSYPVLLGTIYFQRFHKKNNGPQPYINVDLNLIIIEHDDQSGQSWKRTISSHELTFRYGGICKNMSKQPILINPNKMYEISFEVTSSEYSDYYYYPSSNSSSILTEGVTLKFHFRNEKNTGLISRLCFNHL